MNRREKAENKSKSILRAALLQLSDKGFGEAKMEDIAAAAGVAKGTLYLYYPSKESLLTAIADNVANELNEHMESICALPGLSAREKLMRIVEPIFADNGQSDISRAMRLLWFEGTRRPELVKPILEKFFIPAALDLEAGPLSSLAQSGELAPQLQRYPYLLMAPVLQTIIWSGISGLNTVVDFEAAFQAFLDLAMPTSRNLYAFESEK